MHRLAAMLSCALSLWAGVAAAHEMSMAELELREVSSGEFYWQWVSSSDKLGAVDQLAPQWPKHCVAEFNVLHCGAQGLKGELAVKGVGESYSAALVRVLWVDGQKQVFTLTKHQPRVRLFGAAEDRRGSGEIATAYLVLGVEHILSGIDHLMFVLGLLFLVGFNRRLVLTITAFTLAHSLTLGLSALGWLTLRPPPVEATIALSIMLVAAEALHDRPTLTRRWPAAVALVFGLVHGLGFAGALREFGLPENHLLIALLTFNLGVEAGQLLVVAASFALYATLRRLPALAPVRTVALYVIGSAAAFWSIGRILKLLS